MPFIFCATLRSGATFWFRLDLDDGPYEDCEEPVLAARAFLLSPADDRPAGIAHGSFGRYCVGRQEWHYINPEAIDSVHPAPPAEYPASMLSELPHEHPASLRA